MGGVRKAAPLGFEPRALTVEPDPADLRLFRRRFHRRLGVPGEGERGRLLVDTAVAGVFAVGLAVPAAAVVVEVTTSVTTDHGPVLGVALVALSATLAVLGFAVLARPLIRRWRAQRPWRRWFRLSAFAADNGLVYHPEIDAAPQDGSMFRQGRHRRLMDVFVDPDGRFELGTFTFATPDHRSFLDAPRYGYLRVARPLSGPHVVLVAASRRPGGASSVGLTVPESARTPVDHVSPAFEVYALDADEAAARTLVSAELGAYLVAHAAGCDLEFVDDRVFLYRSTPWNPEQLQTWDWARAVADRLGAADRPAPRVRAARRQ